MFDFEKYAEDNGYDSVEEMIYLMCEGDCYTQDYEHLEQEGGGEGGSEYCHGVFKLKGKIYKAEYSYYSYDGHDYNGIYDTLKEVKPVEKTIIVYE